MGIGRFEGYENSLPDKVEVVWQLAKLSDCDYVNPSRESPGHVAKSGCTWTPIEGKVYRKTIDMDVIRSSQAYKRTGSPVGQGAGSEYTLKILFIFNEGELQVKALNGRTNPWL